MIKKLISHFFPLTRKIKSEYSGQLELTLVNGRMVLDTENANYSYGTLHRVLKFALHQIDRSRIGNVLILGLGGGSAIKLLREDFGYEEKITAVEIDRVIIKIAKEEFGICPDNKTRIECMDAVDFVKWEGEKFDLIIVDLFIDNKVPDKIFSKEFWSDIKRRAGETGWIIFNTIEQTSGNVEPIEDELQKSGFKVKEYKNVEKLNRLVIASNSTNR